MLNQDYIIECQVIFVRLSVVLQHHVNYILTFLTWQLNQVIKIHRISMRKKVYIVFLFKSLRINKIIILTSGTSASISFKRNDEFVRNSIITSYKNSRKFHFYKSKILPIIFDFVLYLNMYHEISLLNHRHIIDLHSKRH